MYDFREAMDHFFSGIKESSALRWWYNLQYSMLVNHDLTTATTVHCHQDSYMRLMGESTIIVASPESRCHCHILSSYTPDLWIGSTGMKTLDHSGKSRVYRALTYKQRCEEHARMMTRNGQLWWMMISEHCSLVMEIIDFNKQAVAKAQQWEQHGTAMKPNPHPGISNGVVDGFWPITPW